MAGIAPSQFPNWWVLEYSPPLPLLDPNPLDLIQVSQIFQHCFLGSVLGIWAVSTFLPVVLEHPFYPKTFQDSQEIPFYPKAFLVFQIGASLVFQSTSGFPGNPINPRTFPVSQEILFYPTAFQVSLRNPNCYKTALEHFTFQALEFPDFCRKNPRVELGLALILETECLGKVLEFQSFNLEGKPVE